METWDNKRYHTLNYFLRNKFGDKVFKISLDAGFTCPNRDGS
ncbi:MAG: family radical protein, partial [Clostridia bacterium]|nr:family radical protein [Clostridia bacterium]